METGGQMATKAARPAVRFFSAQKFARLMKGRQDWEVSAKVRELTGRIIGPDTIRSYRSGRTIPSYDNAVAVAAALDSKLDDLGE